MTLGFSDSDTTLTFQGFNPRKKNSLQNIQKKTNVILSNVTNNNKENLTNRPPTDVIIKRKVIVMEAYENKS